ncbi:helix-turn-helix transcriptional regulator [Spirosoma sp. SC4-14]|uniref:helix-turn-helix domain-containing protein n=1 Tax=Spirosoma sp. SC4-14 TaxID=3128900 RepID=UPI0030CBE964
MATFRSEIGSLIRKARMEQGLTQKELGEKIGVGEPTVNKYESGKQNLTVETLKRVADALDMQIKVTFYK